MQVTFWGVRGSIPAPGSGFNRYGGNTACVSLQHEDGPLVILDAGTGITVLGRHLLPGPFGRGRGEAHLFLTHTHWDHIQGFPFFAPAFIPGNQLVIYGPGESPEAIKGLLQHQMNTPYNPVQSLSNLGAGIRFQEFSPEGVVQVGDLRVTGVFNSHGRSRVLSYRIEGGGHTLVYATDVSYPDGDPEESVRRIYEGADLLIHDTTFTPEDLEPRRSRGHSSIAEAARAAAICGVRTLVLFHYDQDYSDEDVDNLEARCRQLLDRQPGGERIHLVSAREGQTLTVP